MAARFDAFISYSRRASSVLAVELRNGVERFAKPWNKLRASRVFLDDASMSANTGLWSTIERGLTEAEWFILLASPASAASEYVTNEISWWRDHKPADRILLVLDEGEIAWDAKAGDFDWTRATAVNPALSKAFAEEPRWVDLSWFEKPESLGTNDPRFTERVADVAAAVRFQERDELIGDNVRERRRAINLLRGGVIALAGLLVASLVATVIAVVNGNAAAEQARIAQARQLAAQAITLSATDLQLASLLAVEAVRLQDDPQTRAALFQLQNASPYLVRSLNVGAQVSATAVAPDGTVVTGGDDGSVSIWRGQRRADPMTLPADTSGVAISRDADAVAAVTPNAGGVVGVWTERGGVQQIDLSQTGAAEDQPPSYVALSPDGRQLAVSDRLNWTSLFAADPSGATFHLIGTAPQGGRVGFGDADFTVFSPLGDWARVSLADASITASGTHVLPQTFLSSVSADGEILAGVVDRGINYQLWYTDSSVHGVPPDSDPPDLVATSAVGGALDIALDADGDRLAVSVDGSLYVSAVRAPATLPEQPLVLDGAGVINVETLSFTGDHLVNGSGDHALVWDLTQTGRITTEFEAPVPDPCNACGPPIVRINPSGSHIVMTDISGFSTVVTDLESGESTTVTSEAGATYTGGAWFGPDRLITFSSSSGTLQVLSGDGFRVVDLVVAIGSTDGAAALAIRSDGSETGRTTVLDETGRVYTVDLATGQVVTESTALVDIFTGQSPSGFDVAPDRSTAYGWVDGGEARVLDVASGEVIYAAESIGGMTYDAEGLLHVFAEQHEWVVDSATGALSPGRTAEVDKYPLVAVNPDGNLVATGGTTGTISLVDVASRGSVVGRVVVPVEDRRQTVSVFTPDGTALVTAIQSMASIDRPATVRRMALTVPQWTAASCAVAGRDLEPAEWRTYVGSEPPSDLRCNR